MYFSVAVIGEKGHLYPLLLHLDIFESVWKHKNWIWSMRVRFHPHVQNAVHCHFSTRLVNQQKRHTFLFYTERHSVWYIVYYCKHILTGICYKECKGKRFILVPKWQSCRVHLQRLAVCVCVRFMPLVWGNCVAKNGGWQKQSEDVRWNPMHHFPALSEWRRRHQRGKYFIS